LSSPKSHYELLGVSPYADTSTLRKAFRKLSKSLHPDTTSLPQEQAADQFQELYKAYELLIDPVRREAYNESINEGPPAEKATDVKVSLERKKSFVAHNIKDLDVRRPFSGGELFSLLLLILAMALSLLIALAFAFFQGRELQVVPSWSSVGQTVATLNSIIYHYVVITFL